MTAADRKVLREAGPFHVKWEAYWQCGAGHVVRSRELPACTARAKIAEAIERLLNEAARPKTKSARISTKLVVGNKGRGKR